MKDNLFDDFAAFEQSLSAPKAAQNVAQPQENVSDLFDDFDTFEQQYNEELPRVLTPASTIGEDLSSLWEGAKQIPNKIVGAGIGASQHPEQAFAGLIPGVTSLADIPAAGINLLNRIPEYAMEKISGQKLPEGIKSGYLPEWTEGDLPYLGEQVGTHFADLMAGEPETELEQASRGGGKALGSGAILSPGSVIKGVGAAAQLPGVKQAISVAKAPFKVAGKAYDYVKEKIPSFPTKSAKENLVANMGEDAKKALKHKKEAESIDIGLTPAEAADNPLLEVQEAASGTTKEGALQKHEYYKAEQAKQEKAINKLLKEVHPKNEIVNEKVRDAMGTIINKRKAARADSVAPMYKDSEHDTVGKMVPVKVAKVKKAKQTKPIGNAKETESILNETKNKLYHPAEGALNSIKSKIRTPTELDNTLSGIKENLGSDFLENLHRVETKAGPQEMEIIWPRAIRNDPTIRQAINKALDPEGPYYDEIQSFAPNSIRVLDDAKQLIDSQIEVAKRAGDEKLKRALTRSKKKLTNQMDKASPTYLKARRTYEKASIPITALEKSRVGQIARKTDEQAQTISQEIFDPKVTDQKRFIKIRQELSNESPEAWNALIRQEMERMLEKGEKSGENFHKSVLQDNRVFKKFQLALVGKPHLQKRLKIMKRSFARLSKEHGVHASAALAEKLNIPSSQGVIKAIRDGIYDKAVVDLSFDNKWDDAFKKLEKAPLNEQDAQFVKLLEDSFGANKPQVVNSQALKEYNSPALNSIMKTRIPENELKKMQPE